MLGCGGSYYGGGGSTLKPMQYKGTWTPSAGNEYPTNDPNVGDLYVISGLTDTGYTFTTGDLNGQTIYNQAGLLDRDELGWDTIANIFIDAVIRIPKTVYISFDGDDTTGEIGNPLNPFATFMGAYNAIPYNGTNWTITYLIREGHTQEHFYENDINLYGHVRSIYLYAPEHVSVFCNSSDNRSLFEWNNTGGGQFTQLRVRGYGSYYRSGSPAITTNCHVFNAPNYQYLNIDGAKTILNYLDTYAIRQPEYIKNVDLIESRGGYAIFGHQVHLFENIKLIKGVGGIRELQKPIINCNVESNGGHSVVSAYGSFIAKDCVFKSDNFIKTADFGTNFIDINNCKFFNVYDADNVCNLELGVYGLEHGARIKNTMLYVANPEGGNGKVNIKTGLDGMADVELSNVLMNIGADFKNTLSQPQIIRRTLVNRQSADVDYSIWASHYYTFSHDDTLNQVDKITITALSTDTDEEVIDKFINAWNIAAATSEYFKGYSLVKGYDGTHWYLESVAEHPLRRLNQRTLPMRNVGADMETTDFDVTIPIKMNGLYNIADPDNLNKSVIIHKSIGSSPIDWYYNNNEWRILNY